MGLAANSLVFDASMGGNGRLTYSNSQNSQNYFVVKYNSTGNVQWVTNYPGVRKITVDASDNMYLVGTVNTSTDLDVRTPTSTIITPTLSEADYIAKINNAGTFIYAKQLDRNSTTASDIGSIKTNNTNVYLTGYYYGTYDLDPSAATNNLPIIPPSSVHYAFFASYDAATGNYNWGKGIGSNGSMFSVSSLVDQSGNLYLTGISNATTIDFDPSPSSANLSANAALNTYLARYSASGDYVWANYFSGVNGFGIALGNNSVYLHGQTSKTTDLDPSNTQNYIPYSTDFIASYAFADGKFAGANSIGGNDNVTNSIQLNYYGNGSIAVDNQQNVYATGILLHAPNPTVDMDPGATVVNATVNGYPNDNYLVKYSPTTVDFSSNRTTVCNTENISLSAVVSGILPLGNQFTFTLSDANGNFTLPSFEFTISATSSFTTMRQIPANLPEGTGYKIRMSSSTAGISSVIKSISILGKPGISVSANSTLLCQGQTATLSATINGSTQSGTYEWKKNGVVVSGATQANLIVNNIIPFFAGYYTCTFKSACLDTTSNPVSISVITAPSISGQSKVCAYQANIGYSVPATPGSTYSWSTPAGITIVSGQTSPNVVVDFSNYSTLAQITLQETHEDGCTTTSNYTITPMPTPPAPEISGSSALCPNAGLQNYSIPNTPGFQYIWTAPLGTNIVGAANGSSISINFQSYNVSGNVTARQVHPLGCSSPIALYPVTALPSPATSPITGPAVVCDNQSNVNYSVVPTSGSTYTWTKPNGSAIAYGQGQSNVGLSFTSSFSNQTLSVVEQNAEGCLGAPVSFLISSNASPSDGVAISGAFSVCGNATAVSYSVPSSPGSTYSWTVLPANKGLIQTGQGSASVEVDFLDFLGYGSVTVIETNAANCSAASGSILVEGLPFPATPAEIIGNTEVCENAGDVQYSVNYVPNASYSWTSPVGTSLSNETSDAPIVHFTNFSGSGTITVRQLNSNGCSSGTASLQVNSLALPNTSPISGTSIVCDNATNVAYSVPGNPGSTYTWTLPNANSTFAGSSNTSSVMINYNGAISAGTLLVHETSADGCSGTPVMLNISTLASPSPSTISGKTNVCAFDKDVAYSIPAATGSTYSWVITPSANAIITTGQGSANVNLDFTNFIGTASLSVTETTIDNCSASIADIELLGNPLPLTPTISGSSNVCSNAGAILYSVVPTLGASYSWTAPTGTTIANETSANPTVNFNSFTGPESITVREINTSTGCVSDAASLVISSLAIPATSEISGFNEICDNAINVSYSVTPTPGSSYSWTLPAASASFAGSSNNASVLINYNGAISNGSLAVIETNAAGCTGSPVTMNITTIASPRTSVIYGNTLVCGNANNVVYYVNATPNSTYNWSVPAGATIQSGGNSNQIQVQFNNAPSTMESIIVEETNEAGCAGNFTANLLEILPYPTTPVISGSSSICGTTGTKNYSVPNTPGSSYAWSMPAGANVQSGQTSSAITVNFSSFNSDGDITVVEKNSDNCYSSPGSFTVAALSIPTTTAISGLSNVCDNATNVVYSITETPGSSYSWTIPSSNVSVVSGQSTSAITLNYSGTITNGIISVTETNSGGCTNSQQISISTKASPANSYILNVNPGLCKRADDVPFSVYSSNIGSTFLWTVPAGSQISSGANTNSITVDFFNFVTNDIISVVETSPNGCSGPVITSSIVAYPTPAAPMVSGPAGLCNINQNYLYQIGNYNPTSQYTWTSPTNTQIQNVNSYSVNVINRYPFFYGDGNITVTERNSYYCTSDPTVIPVNGLLELNYSGPSQVCLGQRQATFTAPLSNGMNYLWQVDGAHSIVSGTSSNQVVVALDAANTLNLSLTMSNVGCSQTAVSSITRSYPPSPNFIQGPTVICNGATTATFTTLFNGVGVRPGSTYAWSLPAGMTINSGAGTNTIQVNVSSFTGSGSVSVVETNSFGCSGTPNALSVKKVSPASAINAVNGTQLCSGQSYIFSSASPYSSSFVWSASPGIYIDRLSLGPAIVATNTGLTGTGFINVTESELGCVKAVSSIQVTGNPSLSIISPSGICSNSTVTFTTQSFANTTYTWYLPAGATLLSGQGTSSATIKLTNFTSGTLSVYSSTVGGCNGSASTAITAAPSPLTSAIVGPGNVCVGTTSAVFSVTNNVNSLYNWSVPAGTTISSGAGTNSITVSIPNPTSISDYISVIESNTNGCVGAQVKKFISSSTDFTSSIIGPTKVCPDAREVLFGVSSTALSTYQWNLPAGASIVVPTLGNPVPNGQGKNVVYVNFAGFTTGTISVQETNSIGCVGIPKSINLGNVSSTYTMPSVNLSCNNPGIIDLALNTGSSISSDVNGMTICFSYNPAVITPVTTGIKYTLGPVVNSGGTALVNYTTLTPGEIRASIYYGNGSSRMSGSGNIITFRFKVAANATAGSSSPITFCGLSEGYGSGGSSAQCITTSAVVNLLPDDPFHSGQLLLMAAPSNTPLRYDATNPSQYLITNISGSSNAACGGISTAINQDINGNFTYNTSNGNFLNINRDIADGTDVSNFINSADAAAVAALTATGFNNRPSMNDILAADVDMNGYLAGNESNLILQRATRQINSFPQMISPSRDWAFIDLTSMNTPAFSSVNYTGLAVGKYYVSTNQPIPVIPACLPLNKISNGTCSYYPAEKYYGILIGDLILGNSFPNAGLPLYANLPNSNMKTAGAAAPEIIIDLIQIEKLSNGNYKVPVYISNADSASAIDLNFDFNQTKVNVLNCTKTNSGLNSNVVFASNNWNNDKFYISGFTMELFESEMALYYLEIDPVAETISKEDFGTLKGLLNGKPVTARVIEKGIATDVTEAEFSNVSVYPNPTMDKLNLVGIEGNFQVSILNVQGDEVFAANNATQINVSDLAAGMYHLKLSSANGSKVIKFNKL